MNKASKGYVYMMYDTDNWVGQKPIYIGKSKNYIRRIEAHFSSMSNGKMTEEDYENIKLVRVAELPTYADAGILERYLIGVIKPIKNTQFMSEGTPNLTVDLRTVNFVELTARDIPPLRKRRKNKERHQEMFVDLFDSDLSVARLKVVLVLQLELLNNKTTEISFRDLFKKSNVSLLSTSNAVELLSPVAETVNKAAKNIMSLTVDADKKTVSVQKGEDFDSWLSKKYIEELNAIKRCGALKSTKKSEFLVCRLFAKHKGEKEFTLSIEELKHELHAPRSLNFTDFKRKILEPSIKWLEKTIGPISYEKIKGDNSSHKIKAIIFSTQSQNTTSQERTR